MRKYKIEERAGVICVVYHTGGVRGASDVEVDQLKEIERKDEALREIAGMVNNGDFGTTCGMIVSGTIYEAVGIAIKALQNKEAENE